MSDGQITCPNCQQPFELTTAMTTAIERRLRQDIDAEAAKRARALDEREQALGRQLAEAERARAAMDEEVAKRVASERTKLADVIKKQAKEDASLELKLVQERLAENSKKLQEALLREEALAKKERALEERSAAIGRDVQDRLKLEKAALLKKGREEASAELKGQLTSLEQELAQNRARLEEARAAELDIRKKAQELEEQKRELDLKVQRTLDEERSKILEKARKEVDEEARLRFAEKDKVVADLQKKLVEMQRKIDQGSQQLQGEVQELDIEAELKACFPGDSFEPVPKGVSGADVLQRVMAPGGLVAGTILWEVKRTKSWSDGWITKLKADQRMAKAEVSALVSATMPKGVESFGEVDGVWVSTRACAMPVASLLRAALIEVATARRAREGQATKMELVYGYLTGPEFKLRIMALKEAFETMMDDLQKERAIMIKQWSKRETQIGVILKSTIGMYGDLQGIAGQQMPVIHGLEIQEQPGESEPEKKRKKQREGVE